MESMGASSSFSFAAPRHALISFHLDKKETPFLLVGASSAVGGARAEEVRISVLRQRGIVVTLRGAETSKLGNDTVCMVGNEQ